MIRRLDAFTIAAMALVWIAAFTQIALRVLVEPAYAAMFRDFGGELPRLTRVFLTPAFPIGSALGLFAASLLSLLFERRALRILFLSTLFSLGAALAGLFFLAMYSPIFQLAQKIQ